MSTLLPDIEDIWSRKMTADEVAESIRRQKCLEETGVDHIPPVITCPECEAKIEPEVEGNTVRYECDGRKECETCSQMTDCDEEYEFPLCVGTFQPHPAGASHGVRCGQPNQDDCAWPSICKRFSK